jgi:hypothetical protein
MRSARSICAYDPQPSRLFERSSLVLQLDSQHAAPPGIETELDDRNLVHGHSRVDGVEGLKARRRQPSHRSSRASRTQRIAVTSKTSSARPADTVSRNPAVTHRADTGEP